MKKVIAQQFVANSVVTNIFDTHNCYQSNASQFKFVSNVVVPEVVQIEVQEAANEEFLEVDFREVKLLQDKKNWMRKFNKHYVEGVNATNKNMFNPKLTKYIAAVENKKEIGFVYLINLQPESSSMATGTWRLDCGYVKGQYRSRRVFQQLIAHVVKKYNVIEISIEHSRFIRNEQYYVDLGFSNFMFLDSSSLGLLVHDSALMQTAASMPLAA